MTRPFAAALARLLFAGAAVVACGARAEAPPTPTRWVTDSAGFLAEATRQDLDGQLETYQRQAGHHVLVWIGRTTGDVPLEDFTVRAFAAWQVGRKGLDDGLVLFVFADDRKVRVEVGYGLEGQVPDAIASRIIRETILPLIQAGDRDRAIRSGVAALLAAIEGADGAVPDSAVGPLPARGSPAREPGPMGLGQKVVLVLAALAFLVLFATNPSLALYLLFSLLSGGRGGGGGGGGYSGGGGRSGGGGASGSW
ncbi:MAG: TPM domain-containing protein [Vicinamibacteria bacterium]|nr:TPM domain-containing protein [Vicinamibacteria bacterium]